MTRKKLTWIQPSIKPELCCGQKRRNRVHCSTLLNPPTLQKGPQVPKQVEQGAFKFLVLIFDKTSMYILSL